MPKFMYIVVRMNCSEENEVMEFYKSKTEEWLHYQELCLELVVGTSKFIRLNTTTLQEKVLEKYHKDQDIIDLLKGE